VHAATEDGLVAVSLSKERDDLAAALYGRSRFVEVAGDAGATSTLLTPLRAAVKPLDRPCGRINTAVE
jgi:hypothetical protein